jgi:hypothetical protein
MEFECRLCLITTNIALLAELPETSRADSKGAGSGIHPHREAVEHVDLIVLQQEVALGILIFVRCLASGFFVWRVSG